MRAAFDVLPELLRVQLWVVPTAGALIAAIAALVVIWVDHQIDALGLPLVIDSDSARAVLTSISGAMISFTALVFSVTMLVLQLASSQLSPRVVRAFLRDRFNQSVLGLFVATFVFSLFVLSSVTLDDVPQLGVFGAIGLVLAAMLAFVAYLDHMAHAIRPTSVLEAITDETRSVIDAHYAAVDESTDAGVEGHDDGPADDEAAAVEADRDDSMVTWVHGSGYIEAVDQGALIRFAEREGHDVVMEVGAGHFLMPGMALLRVPDGKARSMPASAAGLDGVIHLGAERTMSQDPEFGFRQLVDVALRALSPALNDPTTANQVIDRLVELLWHLQTRTIEAPKVITGDGGGSVAIPAPDWDAFLDLSVDEISAACDSMPSVEAHLRAALEDLRARVRAEHRTAVSRALMRLSPAATTDASP